MLMAPPEHAPNSRQRRWTAAEDRALKDLVSRYGDKRGPEGRWKDIAKRFAGRNEKVVVARVFACRTAY